MAREWWEHPTPEEVEAYWKTDEAKDAFAENLVRAIEKLELGGLVRPGIVGESRVSFAEHLRRTFGPAFDRVYKKRREGGGSPPIE